MALRDAVGFTYLLLWVSIVSCFKQKIREGVNWLIMVRSPEGEAKAHSFTLSPACFLDPSFRFLLGTQVIRKAVFFTSRRGYSAGGSKSDHLVRRNPHEEKSCSCKSNIFYLTYLAVSCLAHTRLGEWFIFDWHGPLDVRDLVCWPGPSMSLDLYVWISYEIPYFFSFQNDQHTVWLLRDSSCISFVALHEHLDIGKRTPLIRNFIDREGWAKRERLTPDQCWLTTE